MLRVTETEGNTKEALIETDLGTSGTSNRKFYKQQTAFLPAD